MENDGGIESKNLLKAREKVISDEELGKEITAGGNHEAKGIVLFAMMDGRTYSTGDLHREVMRMQGISPGWKIDTKGPREFCTSSFAPAGLVSSVTSEAGGGYAYKITPKGQVSISLFGHLMDLSLRHTRKNESEEDYSLIQLFGSSAFKGGKESDQKEKVALTRIQILRQLYNASNPLSIRDFEMLNGVISRIITDYDDEGIVTAKGFFDGEEDEMAFTLPQQPSQEQTARFHHLTALPSQVLHIIQSMEPGSLIVPMNIVNKLTQIGFRNNMRPDVLRTQVRKILYDFSTKGYVLSEFETGTRSSVWLDPAQRQLIGELLGILDAYQAHDPSFLEKGRKRAEEIASSPTDVAKLMEKAHRKSPYGNKIDQAELASEMKNVLSSTPLTSEQLRDGVRAYFKRRVPRKPFSRALALLSSNREIEFTPEGKWRVVNL